MKTVIVYDSLYGNTRAVAEAIGRTVGGEVELVRAEEAVSDTLQSATLVIVGSPTHGGRPSEKTKRFLDQLPAGALQNVRAAAFSTGVGSEGQSFFLRAVIGLFGYAAPHILRRLQERGATSLGSENFFVTGKEGPLREGELDRAARWGAELGRQLPPA